MAVLQKTKGKGVMHFFSTFHQMSNVYQSSGTALSSLLYKGLSLKKNIGQPQHAHARAASVVRKQFKTRG